MRTKTVTLQPTSINGEAAEFPVDVGSNGIKIRYDLSGINTAAFNSIRCTISGFSYQWYEEGYGYVQGLFYAALYNSAKQRVATIADSQYKEVYPRENTNFTIPFSASSNRQYSIYDGYYLEVELYCAASHYDAGGINSWLESNGITVTINAQYDDLTIEEITPSTANVGDEVTVKFGNWLGEKITLTLTANNRTIATFYSSNGTYTFTCGTDWFTKAGATGNEFDITVTAVEDGALQRTAKSSFKLKREGIGTEITQQPISTGSNSLLKLKFNKRNGHELHLLIEGTAKGSSNRVKLVPSTSESYITVSADTYTVTAADSWFNSINGSEMSVYITVTDAVDKRQDKLSAFTLKAGDALLPTISSITLLNISGNELLDDYGYVVGYSRIGIRVNGTTYSGTSVQSIIAKVGTEQITCSYNSTVQAYVGETSGTISSKSRVTITITVTDSRGRVNTGYAYIEASDITVLPNIGLTQSKAILFEPEPNSVYYEFAPNGYIGDYRIKVTANNDAYVLKDWVTYKSSFGWNMHYNAFFVNTNNQGKASMQIRIYIVDDLGRTFPNSKYVEFVLFAPNPSFKSFEYEHIPDERMPDTASVQPTKADVVSGYSKLRLKARVQWFYEPESVIAKESANTYTLNRTSDYSSASWPREADYTYEPESVLATNYSQLTFTPTAKDQGTITSGSFRRTGETTNTNYKRTVPIYRLQNMTVTPPSTVDTDAQATIRVNNFVGSYAYEAKIANDTVSESDEPIITPTFSVFADPAWFESASTPTLTVYVTVEDVLGRTQTVSFTVRLNRFVLTLLPTSDIQIDGDIQISVEGSGSQQVAIVLTTPKGSETLELASTTATTTSPATVTCPRTWFTDHTEFDNVYQLPITVTASYAGRSTSQSFKLVYPALGLTLQKSDGSGDTATEAEVGDNIIYAFSHQEGEDVNVHYYYSNFSTPIRSLGPYSESSATIATPQLFDDANANTVQTMKVSVVISDKRGRTARVDNFTVKVNELMHPYVSSFSVTPLNPSTIVKEDLKNKFIENVSKFRVSIVFNPQTKAAMKPESVYVVLCRGYEWNEDTGRREYEGVYGRFPMTQIIEENNYNKFVFESDFTIPVFNKSFVADKDGIMKGGSVLVIEAQDQRNMSARLNRWMSWIGMQPDIYMYSLPRATDIHYHRCNQDETPNDAGEYCHVAIDYQFTGFWNGLLPPTAYNVGRVSATLDSETQYEDLPFSTSGGEQNPQDPDVPDTGTVEFTFDNVSMERTYDITITLSDLITSTTYTVRLSTAGVIMDFLRDGKGLALGKVAEHQGMVEVNPEWTLQAEKMKVRVKDGTDDKGLYDIGQLLCQILNRMNNGGL